MDGQLARSEDPVGTEASAPTGSTGEWLRAQEALRRWHREGHPGISDSPAWTHCVCFGAAWRAADALRQENELLLIAATVLYGAHDRLTMDTEEDEALRLEVLRLAREAVPELPERARTP